MATKVNIALVVGFGGLAAALVALIPREKAPVVSAGWEQALAVRPEPTPAPGEISVLSLVDDMIDLEELARFPEDSYVARQESSYDRRSRRPEDGDAWFANDDFVTNVADNLVRVETTADGAKRYVLLDAKGPGAVVRLWTASPAGTLRIFIDDEPRPALEASMEALLSGAVAPFTPPFGQVTSMGRSLYFPFPFRARCLITVDSIQSLDPFSGRSVDRLFYQVGYRQYGEAARARVRPFSEAELRRAAPALARVGAVLQTSTRAEPSDPLARVVPFATVTLAAGQQASTSLAAPDEAGGAITRLRLRTPERDPVRLRATILSIAFDGEETVRAPLVDFFGTGPGWNATVSLPFSVDADGTLTCRFVMPFRKTAVVSVARLPSPADASPGAPLELSGDITVEPRAFAGTGAAFFHARFRPPASLPTRPKRDWHGATLRGRGRQVGTVLSVENPAGTSWWGEGDEKLYVDGETFPSFFGTGTEDYFGFAWSSTAPFAHAYHAQTLAPRDGFGGWFSMNRFLIADPLPFTTQLRFDMELWHWSDTTVTLSAMLYWYAAPGGGDDFPP
ncbi:MAG TPA: glycoside hydrolase family 172 protein [Polyangia bacterium]